MICLYELHHHLLEIYTDPDRRVPDWCALDADPNLDPANDADTGSGSGTTLVGGTGSAVVVVIDTLHLVCLASSLLSHLFYLIFPIVLSFLTNLTSSSVLSST